MPAYLDCNATTPVEKEVAREVHRFLVEEFGNPASPVHMYGTIARMVIEKARRDVAALVDAQPDEVIFNSGTTESNNLALLGFAEAGLKSGRTHEKFFSCRKGEGFMKIKMSYMHGLSDHRQPMHVFISQLNRRAIAWIKAS